MKNLLLRIYILSVTLIFLKGFIFAGDISIKEILIGMEEAENKIASVQFEFVQEITYSLTNEKQSNSGEVKFKKPSSLYLRHTKPIEQIIVSNGKKVWLYTPEYNQVIIDSWKKWAGNSMIPASVINFGQNLKDLKKLYIFKYIEKKDDKYVLLLIPRAKDHWQLKLWVDIESFIPTRAIIEGDNIIINTETNNYKTNVVNDMKIFEFEIPKGAEVLALP